MLIFRRHFCQNLPATFSGKSGILWVIFGNLANLTEFKLYFRQFKTIYPLKWGLNVLFRTKWRFWRFQPPSYPTTVSHALKNVDKKIHYEVADHLSNTDYMSDSRNWNWT